MFERYLSDVVTRQFGHFVEGLDSDQVRLSTWKGELVFENVNLRPDALQHLMRGKGSCPFEIEYGRIGHLQISLPWKLLRHKFLWRTLKNNNQSGNGPPTLPSLILSVSLTDVDILITPKRKRHQQEDENEDNLAQQQQQQRAQDQDPAEKEAAVQASLDAQLLKRVAAASTSAELPSSSSKSSSSQRWRWFQDSVADILSNLTVTVKNIHIRYEDSGTSLGFSWSDCDDRQCRYRPPFAIGITLKQFSVKTTEKEHGVLGKGTETEMSSKESDKVLSENDLKNFQGVSHMRRKLVTTDQLAVYWDSDCRIMAEVQGQLRQEYYKTIFEILNGEYCNTKIQDMGVTSILRPAEFCKIHSFLLQPFSPSIELKIANPQTAKELKEASQMKDSLVMYQDNDSPVLPSTLDAALPPFRLTVSRDLLSDLGYLRQSYAVWSNASKGAVSEKTLRRLASLRPKVSPLTNPRGWWMYVYEVVLAVQRQESGLTQNHMKQRYGWLGLAKALARRNKYVQLYKAFNSSQENVEGRVKIHSELLRFEQVLSVEEITAFRISSYHALKNLEAKVCGHDELSINYLQQDSAVSNLAESEDKDYILENGSILSPDHRSQMYTEMARVLAQEEVDSMLQQLDDGNEISPQKQTAGIDNSGNTIKWLTTISCSEVALQINDRTQRPEGPIYQPVARLSFICLLEQRLYRDSSWDLSNEIGSLQVEDCISDTFTGDASSYKAYFPYLIGPKGGKLMKDGTLYLNGSRHHQSVKIHVRRSAHSFASREQCTTTTTEVIVLPLELVYSTAPMEALSRIFSTVNSQFSDDYQRVASKVFEWRKRQRKRFLQALAHKQKKIIVNVEMGAPLLLVPENNTKDSPLLIADFGQLQFRNDQSDQQASNSDFDDNWRLDMTDIQVQCSITHIYRMSTVTHNNITSGSVLQQLIEPLSVNIKIFTRVLDEATNEGGGSHIKIVAKLPRLVVNITSSALRLIQRLKLQWDQRKVELMQFIQKSTEFYPSHSMSWNSIHKSDLALPADMSDPSRGTFELKFNAPLLRVCVENDVDGRDCRQGDLRTKTSIVDLAMKGMDAKFRTVNFSSGVCHSTWSARLRSLDAFDLYQGAGVEYAYLLSSVSPDLLVRNARRESIAFDSQSLSSFLVTFEYDSRFNIESKDFGQLSFAQERDFNFCPRLSIKFHELYIEWNPETLAALQLAMRLPKQTFFSGTDKLKSDDDTFFDAEEDDYHDAESIKSDDHELKSPPVSATSLVFPALDASERVDDWTKESQFPLRDLTSLQDMVSSTRIDNIQTSPTNNRSKRSKLVFELHKLRVHFNKESRHRRLVVAEMDRTLVQHETSGDGGSVTCVSIGNLVFSDADSLQGKTLYRDILGLKTDSNASSLLELRMTRCPRSRQYVTDADRIDFDQNVDNGVLIHTSNGQMTGYDLLLSARLSPMRFVYLQQLWFEFIDYFFEGIMGSKVWGVVQTVTAEMVGSENYAPNADSVSFTKVEVMLESPIILFPVSYCCTNYIRLEAAQLSLKNSYNYGDMRNPEDGFLSGSRKQWFNNYVITLNQIKFSSSSGGALNDSNNYSQIKISINWPIGVTAFLNVPKWQVNCVLNPLYLTLLPDDFALLQHVIQYNIGEESRHLDEWHALENLPPLVLEQYKQDITVHFGYDKKDVAPTTFDIKLFAPTMCFRLQRGVRSAIAEVKCEKLCWTFKKLRDLISHQSVSCDLHILDATSSIPQTLLESRRSFGFEANTADMTYNSQYKLPGNTTKKLEIISPHILFDVLAWRAFVEFFQGLPQPSYLSPNEVIQVGDKWYRISEKSGVGINYKSRFNSRMSWIQQSETATPGLLEPISEEQNIQKISSEFCLLLLGPTIILGSERSSLVLRAEEVELRYFCAAPNVEKDINVVNLQLQAFDSQQKLLDSSKTSVIRPWSFTGKSKQVNDTTLCKNLSHSVKIDANVLKTRASFTDMKVAIEVCLRLARDIKSLNPKHTQKPLSPQWETTSLVSTASPHVKSLYPVENHINACWGGLELVVVDDSGRHFANAQDLIFMCLRHLTFTRTAKLRQSLDRPESMNTVDEYTSCLRILSFDLIDCLQSKQSPFRTVASIRAVRTLLPREVKVHATVDAPSSHTNDTPEIDYAIVFSSTTVSSRTYLAKIRSVDLQYNPSMMIALQRFLGRLYKDARHAMSIDASFPSFGSTPPAESESEPQLVGILVAVNVEHLRICLNKEHLGRQLLELILSDCDVAMNHSNAKVDIQGHIGSFDAWENKEFGRTGRNLLKFGNDKENFIDFHYRRYSCSKHYKCLHREYPDWVTRYFDEEIDEDIDDCLDVSIAALEFVFLKEKIDELLDYLSNGMPGRGMGATSQAAKGFVNKRIATKSLLHIHVEAPTIRIPKDDVEDVGVTCRLGDLSLKSWVRQDGDDAVRMLSIALVGFSAGTYFITGLESIESSYVSDINISIQVEKTSEILSGRATLSEVCIRLKYSDYICLRLVCQLNIFKKSNRERWDNLEVAWEEEASQSNDYDGNLFRFSKDVIYSSSARHVRFGKPSKNVAENQKNVEVDIKLDCGKLSLLLQHDDVIAESSSQKAPRNVVLLYFQSFDLSAKRRRDASQSLSASIGDIFMFDVGESSHQRTTSGLANFSKYIVLVEGYSSSEKSHLNDSQAEKSNLSDSQIVLTFDKAANDSSISVVVNHLSLAACLRPMEDLVAYLTCRYSSKVQSSTVLYESQHNLHQTGDKPNIQVQTSIEHCCRRLQLKLVLHYPRLIFVADETNYRSRALVLQGLAMLTATRSSFVSTGAENEIAAPVRHEQIQADFQNISSHITPDVSEMVSVTQKHVCILTDSLSDTTSEETHNNDPIDFNQKNIQVGVPLLLPLTIGVEFEQKFFERLPSSKSFLVNIESVAAMVSIQDLQLISLVANKWSPDKQQSKSVHYFDITFNAERLGLGLRKEGSKIIVDNADFLASQTSLRSGDGIYAVNGVVVLDSADINEFKDWLINEPRPLVLTFFRIAALDKEPENLSENADFMDKGYEGKFENIDVSISNAVLTVMEKEVKLLRCGASSIEIGCRIELTDRKLYFISISTVAQIDYYNLRIWCWEPFLEPAGLFLRAELTDTCHGPKELSVELCDRPKGPISFNLSDAAFETLSKLWLWRERLSSDLFAYGNNTVTATNDDFAMDNNKQLLSLGTADAALQFAQRQNSGAAKPFLIRNKTGLSIAVVQQRINCKRWSVSRLVEVEDYFGLEDMQDSDIIVVANGEEAKLQITVESGINDIDNVGRFPRLLIAFQAVEGVVFKPLRDLEISRPGETSIPLFIVNERDTSNLVESQSGIWALWNVEPVDDGKTVLTLGSSVRLVASLQDAIEIGVAVVGENESIDDWTDNRIKYVGSSRFEEVVHLPLWLAMYQRRWMCFVKAAGNYRYAMILKASNTGEIKITVDDYVQCEPLDDNLPSVHFAVYKNFVDQKTNFDLIITIDCAIVFRNFLPMQIHWEFASVLNHSIIDASELRKRKESDLTSGSLISSGRVDILSEGYNGLEVRLRSNKGLAWSNWVPLSLSTMRLGSQIQDTVVRQAALMDTFGISMFLALRFSRRRRGVEVTVYSELWCSNCASLPLAFGYLQEGKSGQNGTWSHGEEDASQISAAESALKEISSLFETGDEGKEFAPAKSLGASSAFAAISRLPAQTTPSIVEEAFEYEQTNTSAGKRRWWATENPFLSLRHDVTTLDDNEGTWRWLDDSWIIDRTGHTSEEGWESTVNLNEWSTHRRFKEKHRFRRRRWFRHRTGDPVGSMLSGVHAIYHPPVMNSQINEKNEKERKEQTFRVAVQIDGGRWALTSSIPQHGSVYGALRVSKRRWAHHAISTDRRYSKTQDYSVFELCYSISTLDGEWGEFTRLMLITSRFLVRNDSQILMFELKQSGADDCTAIKVAPGETISFNWEDSRLPELICARPSIYHGKLSVYRWSGGFDPLTIGSTPLRIRKNLLSNILPGKTSNAIWNLHSIKVESELRPRTGRTGLNISLQEENECGIGSLFRVENFSFFPIWFAQDGVLANHLPGDGHGHADMEGDIVRHNESLPFALDVPFRQGKYTGRKAATLSELLRARIGLAPLSSRAGIETTKVVSMTTIGERVHLCPSSLTIYTVEMRSLLSRIRVLGLLLNDGPTRVLRFSLVTKSDDNTFFSPFSDDSSISTSVAWSDSSAKYYREIFNAALMAKDQMKELLSEDKAIDLAQSKFVEQNAASKSQLSKENDKLVERDLIISFRAAFQGFIVSLIDSAPSEICLLSLENLNALATWNKLQTTDSTAYLTVTGFQVDNMVPNAPFPVALHPLSSLREQKQSFIVEEELSTAESVESVAPLLVIGVAFAPKDSTGIVCLRSFTIAPKNLAVNIDLAFLVRLQKYALDIQSYFVGKGKVENYIELQVPDIINRAKELNEAAAANVGRQKFYFGGLTILPCNIKLSVAPARALTQAQSVLEGQEAAAIHQAVRKGDVRLGDTSGLLGVKVGHRNATPLAVVRGVFKSIVVDALLRLDGANLNFAGVVLRNYTSTSSQLVTLLSAHYLASLRQNVPALLGSLAAFGNPLGLVRGLGDGVSDFVLEPMKGFQRSVQEMDPTYLVDGVARGTLSLARHTVGGFADSAAMLTETFSKNMTVLTLDRRYAQKRDRKDSYRGQSEMNVAAGIGNGVQKLVQGFVEGVTGVVKAPLRGAEKRGFEGFAKGIGKGLLGLLVKPIIGISDGITAVMIGVKVSVEGPDGISGCRVMQVRPRRALYGSYRLVKIYNVADAAAQALMLRTRLAGENYSSHLDMGDRLALLSTKRLLLMGPEGEELLILKFKHIESLEMRSIEQEDGSIGWGIIVLLKIPRRNGSEVEVISCRTKSLADELLKLIKHGFEWANHESSTTIL